MKDRRFTADRQELERVGQIINETLGPA